jgi:hypothetical protein
MGSVNAFNNEVLTANVTFNGGTVSIGTDATSGAINIGTGAAARVTTLGNTTGASVLALKCGTGDFTLASATGTIISALDTGEITEPLQPAFQANGSATVTNVTGNAAVYTPVFNTEVFDQNADYNNGTGVFTAPVTGKYRLSCTMAMAEVTNGTLIYMYLVTSNRSYLFSIASPTACKDVNNQFTANGTVLADMDAADTANVTIQISGIAGNTADWIGTVSYFSGELAC